MLDYEIVGYKIEYRRVGACSATSSSFDTEEEAIAFINDNRSKWSEYRLMKIQTAIIDF